MQELLSQRDIHWINHKIGASNITVGGYGCALTCASMTSAEFGGFKDPAFFAKQKPMFTKDGLILWKEIVKYVPCMRFEWRQYGYSAQTIANYLVYGKKATQVEVMINPKTNMRHWLKVVSIVKMKNGIDYLCSNPINGKRCYVFATYGKITGSAHFVKA